MLMMSKGKFRTFSVMGLGSMLGLAGALGGSMVPTSRDELNSLAYSLNIKSLVPSTDIGTGKASPCCYQRAEAARIKAALEGKAGPTSCEDLARFESGSPASTDLVLLGDDLSQDNVNAFTMGLMGYPREPLSANR